MSKKQRHAISPTRQEDYPEWYQQVVKAADLAETSPVRGCMVIKPWGYAIWENIQREMDDRFKATGHVNAYFPLFIPLSFMQKEAEHVEGFAKECAVVTHHRLAADAEGRLAPSPDAQLEEPLVVRPTSETIIGEMFARWIQSYRDLPLLINQWCNIVRWELRTRLFLRTAEFLWQEGHTAHADAEEAIEEQKRMLNVYGDFAEEFLAMPVIRGTKTEAERFPGALDTMCIEAMMQDRKALQAGTSHFLGQNFAKAAEIKFLDSDGQEKLVWTTSWGSSTRLVGGLIMTHSDDDGLVLPPRVAPAHVVVLPIAHKEETRAEVMEYCDKLAGELREQRFDGRPLRVEIDKRDLRGGEKAWSWIKKGVPYRLEVGPRDIASDSVFAARRDTMEKAGCPRGEFVATIERRLEEMQEGLFRRAGELRESNTRRIDSKEEFYDFFTPSSAEKPEIHGGFAWSHWSGESEVEEQAKSDLGVTVRCIPFESEEEEGRCVISGRPSRRRVLFAKAY